jgi:hypothetical protein
MRALSVCERHSRLQDVGALGLCVAILISACIRKGIGPAAYNLSGVIDERGCFLPSSADFIRMILPHKLLVARGDLLLGRQVVSVAPIVFQN